MTSPARIRTPGIANGFGANGSPARSDRYKWIALSNTTLAVLLATLDASITLIAMPDIFRGIHLDPLVAGNSFYLLWMVLGYLVVSSVLIVSLGRLGDMFGRVKLYNLGFVIYTVASLLLTVDWMTGRAGATYLIVFRIVQGVGGAFLLANSAAILTDAFPANQRGMALGINNIVGVSGLFVGLILGGLLAPISWRMVFLISVPVGLFGTVWAYLKLQELSTPRRTRVDWPGNITFALGLILIMVSVTYGIRPWGGHPTGWTSPRVIALLGSGVACLVAFVFIERRSQDPMFRLPLLEDSRVHVRDAVDLPGGRGARRADVHADHLAAGDLASPARLQLHRYAALGGHLHAAVDGRDADLGSDIGLSIRPVRRARVRDRRDDRRRAELRAARAAADRLLIPGVRGVLFMNGVSMGLFASPNRAAVMNSLPPGDRGAGGGMNQTFQNSAQVLSVGIFFSLMIAGLASSLPHTLSAGLQAHGVDPASAARVGQTPPVAVLFAAFLGYNPIEHLAGPHVLAALTAHSHAIVTGRSFFPELISGPFRTGLHEAFAFAILACLVAAAASAMRGGRYHHEEIPPPSSAERVESAEPAAVGS